MSSDAPKPRVSSLAAAAAAARAKGNSTTITSTPTKSNSASRTSTLQKRSETKKPSSLQAERNHANKSSLNDRQSSTNTRSRKGHNSGNGSSNKNQGKDNRKKGGDYDGNNDKKKPEASKRKSKKNTRERGPEKTPHQSAIQFEILLDSSEEDDDNISPPPKSSPQTSSLQNKNHQTGRREGNRNTRANGKVIDVGASNRLIGHALGKRIPSKQHSNHGGNQSSLSLNKQKNERNHFDTRRKGRDHGRSRGADRNNTKHLGDRDDDSGFNRSQGNHAAAKANVAEKVEAKQTPKLKISQNTGPVERKVQVTNWADDSDGDY
jgi:hypothetical protein